MSAAVINSYRAIKDFNNKLSDSKYGERYGEVFISERRSAVLRCCLCEEEHLIYQQFLEHIFAHIYSNIGTAALHFTSGKTPAELVVSQAIDLEEQKNASANVPSVEFATEVLPAVGNFQLTEHITQVNSLCEVQIELKKEVRTELDELPLVEAAHETCCVPEKDDPVRVTSECSRESSPKPKPKRKYTRQKPFAKKQSDKHNERAHKCETCGVVLKSNRALREHSQRHTGEPRFECEVCKKGFYTNGELTVHKRRHTGERPFVCKFCGGRFTSSSWRNRHEKQHERRLTNARAYKCEICEKGFNEAVNLKEHMVVHSRERKHVCCVCSAAFLHRKNLIVHMKIHTNAREYACNICGRAFNQSAARMFHMKNKHKVVDVTNVKFAIGSSSKKILE